KQLCVFVTFHIRSDKIEEWKAVHRRIWTPVGNERECLLFDVFESKEEPGLIRLVEVWEGDREWFENVQMKKPYYSLLWEKSQPLWTEPVKLEYFERAGEGSVYRDTYL
ncbi:hypothetical protein K458DRAFT_250015, partial [Lentithecium fluviatile CBS 122367]